MPVPDPTVPPGSADITLPLPISEQPQPDPVDPNQPASEAP